MIKSLILLLSLTFIFACGHTEGTIQKGEESFFVFSGNLENVKIHIDELQPFTPSIGKHYQIRPGKHTVMAYRDGNLLLNRMIILENQVTTEIKIP